MSETDLPSLTKTTGTNSPAATGQEIHNLDSITAVPTEKLVHTLQATPPPPPPVPAPPPTPPLRPSGIRTPEFTSASSLIGGAAASPSLSSINTTPRQGSSKRYPTHQVSIGSTYGDRKQLTQQNASRAPVQIAAPTVTSTQEKFDLHYVSTDNLLNIGNRIQYPHLLVSTTKLKPIDQCTVLCCFYAEFDNTVGPKICYQYPPDFMSELDIQSTPHQLEGALQRALLQGKMNEKKTAVPNTDSIETTTSSDQIQQRNEIPLISSSEETPKATGGRTAFQSESSTTAGATNSVAATPTTATPENSTRSSKITTNNNLTATNSSTTNESSSSTIFDSCSEYIITGSELAGNIINVSTHNIHLLSRPTILVDEETYERNTLLFSIGFVLRRTMDPQPYRPILSKLVLTIRDMEIESQFLSQRKEQMQSILEGIVRSMNSYNSNSECNILLGPADVLHFKLFRPPRAHVTPVTDYSVPILVRRDWLHQGYEWDLSINWVSLHIDGVANAKQISKRAEVDLEMVRACLRVLKQHNVVHVIDMFCYSNRYEWTGRIIGPDMLHDAVEYVVKHTELRVTPTAKDNKSEDNAIREYQLSKSPPIRARGDNEATSMEDSFGGGTSLPRNMSHMKCASLTGSSLPNHDSGTSLLASTAMQHKDYVELQNAIVEFYAACHRDIPICEVWIALITKRQPTTIGVTTTNKTINWKKVFRLIDHRRLICFGIIHGYIRRFHNHPFLVNRNSISMDDDPSTPKYSNIQRQTSISSHDRIGRGSSHSSYTQHVLKTEQAMRRTQLKQQTAFLMDGMHCDDEIVCTVEMPFDEVLAMFPKNGVVSVFAAR